MDALAKTEAGRILAVLEEGLTKLDLVSTIPVRRVRGAHIGLMSELNSSAFEAMNSHWESEEPVAEFERRLKGQRMGGSTPIETVPPVEVVKPFRSSLKKLCTLLRDSGETRAVLAEYQTDQPKGTDRIRETIQTLVTITQNACKVTKEEEDHRKQFLADLLFRIEAEEEGCRSLEFSLADATAKKQKETKAAQDQIDRMEMTSADLVENRDLIVADAKGKADTKRAERAAANEALSERLQKRIEELEALVEQRGDKARDVEGKCRRRMVKIQEAIDTVVSNYDRDMTELMDKVKVVREQHARSEAELRVAEEEFEMYDMDMARQAKEEAIIEEANAAQYRTKMEGVLKIIMVQTVARRIIAKRRVQDLLASRKKGKKGGKKKGGKKKGK